VPVHYEGWSHFREGRDGIERALAAARDVGQAFTWLTLGAPTTLAV
jgi:hypothetical protein